MALLNLERAGQDAYKRSVLLRDMHDVFNFQPFQRLMSEMKNPDHADTVRMFFELYQFVEEQFQRLGPMERLGVLDALLSDAEVRSALVHQFNQRSGQRDTQIVDGSTTPDGQIQVWQPKC